MLLLFATRSKVAIKSIKKLFISLRRPGASTRHLPHFFQSFFLPRDPAFRDSWHENEPVCVCSSTQRLLVLEIGPSARQSLRNFQSQYFAGDEFAHDCRRFWRMHVFNYSAFLARDENISEFFEIIDFIFENIFRGAAAPEKKNDLDLVWKFFFFLIRNLMIFECGNIHLS